MRLIKLRGGVLDLNYTKPVKIISWILVVCTSLCLIYFFGVETRQLIKKDISDSNIFVQILVWIMIVIKIALVLFIVYLNIVAFKTIISVKNSDRLKNIGILIILFMIGIGNYTLSTTGETSYTTLENAKYEKHIVNGKIIDKKQSRSFWKSSQYILKVETKDSVYPDILYVDKETYKKQKEGQQIKTKATVLTSYENSPQN